MLTDLLLLVLASPLLTGLILSLLGIEAQAVYDLFENLLPCGSAS